MAILILVFGPSHLEDVTAILENPGTGFSASKAFFKKDISNGEG